MHKKVPVMSTGLRSLLLAMFCIVAILAAGLRLPGLDRDYEQYEAFYNLSLFQMEYSRFELGFRWLASSATAMELPFLAFLLLVACISVPLKFYVVSRVSQRSMVPWLYYIPYFFVLLDMTAVRLGLASAILMLGIYLWFDSRRWIGGLLVVASVLFHYQMLVPITAFAAFGLADRWMPRYRVTVSALLAALGAAAAFLVARYTDLERIGQVGEWTARYVDASVFSGAAWYQPSVIQSIVILTLGRCALVSPQRLVRVAWVVGAFGVLIYYALSGIGTLVFRLADGLLFFNLLWLGYAARNASAWDRLLMKLSVSMFLVFYLILFYQNEVPFLRFAERWSST